MCHSLRGVLVNGGGLGLVVLGRVQLVEVLIERRPLRLLFGRREDVFPGLVALDGQFGDGLLEPHEVLHRLARGRHGVRQHRLRQLASLFENGSGDP